MQDRYALRLQSYLASWLRKRFVEINGTRQSGDTCRSATASPFRRLGDLQLSDTATEETHVNASSLEPASSIKSPLKETLATAALLPPEQVFYVGSTQPMTLSNHLRVWSHCSITDEYL